MRSNFWKLTMSRHPSVFSWRRWCESSFPITFSASHRYTAMIKNALRVYQSHHTRCKELSTSLVCIVWGLLRSVWCRTLALSTCLFDHDIDHHHAQHIHMSVRNDEIIDMHSRCVGVWKNVCFIGTRTSIHRALCLNYIAWASTSFAPVYACVCMSLWVYM